MSHNRKVIFVVDDEAVIAETLAIILIHAGFRAIAFYDPHKALAAAIATCPDLLLTDVMMPGMNGIELAIHFRESLPKCEILLFSGQPQTADLLAEAQAQGYHFDLLAKPMHPTALLDKIRN